MSSNRKQSVAKLIGSYHNASQFAFNVVVPPVACILGGNFLIKKYSLQKSSMLWFALLGIIAMIGSMVNTLSVFIRQSAQIQSKNPEVQRELEFRKLNPAEDRDYYDNER